MRMWRQGKSPVRSHGGGASTCYRGRWRWPDGSCGDCHARSTILCSVARRTSRAAASLRPRARPSPARPRAHSAEHDPQRRFQLRKRGCRIFDFDGAHAHRLRGLEVGAQVVEIDGLFGSDAELRAHQLEKTRLGFACAELRGFDYRIEQVEHRLALRATLRVAVEPVAWPGVDVIGYTGVGVMLFARPERTHHLRPHFPIEQVDDIESAYFVSRGARFRCVRPIELPGGEFGTLEAGPGVTVGIAGIDFAQEVRRQPTSLLETTEGDKRTFGHHAAEVPEHGAHRRVWHPRPTSCSSCRCPPRA